jgi:hypothetical protein
MFSCADEVQNQETDESLLAKQKEAYIEQGKAIAQNTFKALSGALSSKIQSGGIPEALNYCNIAAMPLTDSIASTYNAHIKRISDKARNQANLPYAMEAAVIESYKSDLANGKDLLPVLEIIDDEVFFMAPIIIQPLCLNCHGVPEVNIAPSNLALINEMYPEDKAINYSEGELRGIWSIQFDKE